MIALTRMGLQVRWSESDSVWIGSGIVPQIARPSTRARTGAGIYHLLGDGRAECENYVGALIGRVLMSAIFIWSGYAKLITPTGTAGYFGSLGLPMPGVVWLSAVTGVQTRLALVLGIWCIVTALVAHTNFADLNMQIKPRAANLTSPVLAHEDRARAFGAELSSIATWVAFHKR
jgi:putative oxidoreductase